MNAISSSTAAASASLVNGAAVAQVRPVVPNSQRAPAPQADRFVRSSASPAMPQVTYARNGGGGHADADGDGD